MYFRSRKKSAQDVSLSDTIDAGSDGAPLELMDVLSSDTDLLENLSSQESIRQLRKAVKTELSEQERQILTLRYGLCGGEPLRQREVAARTGISRSYVSRRH